MNPAETQINRLILGPDCDDYLHWDKEQIDNHYKRGCKYVALSSIAAEQDRLKEEKRRLADERKIAAAKKKVDIAARKEAKEKEKAILATMTPEEQKLYKKRRKLQQQLDNKQEPVLPL